MLSEQVKMALKMLQFDQVPRLAELRARFLKMCIERHPDKGGSNKEFQDLLEAKDVVSKYINKNVPENNLDEEEKFTRHLFKEFILVKIHKTSVLLTYPTKVCKTLQRKS